MMAVVTGGSGSGKSAFAEDKILSLGQGKRFYIATMHPYDEESYKRVERHRKMRAGKGFETVECYTGLENLEFPQDAIVLLECMSNLLANEQFEIGGTDEEILERIQVGIQNLDTVRYQEYLGKINQKLGEMADQVVEVVYGIPIWHKGGKTGENAVE